MEGSEVNLMRTVRGAATLPGSHVQLLVYAADRKWYPQRRAAVDGRAWSAECQFGNNERGSGEHYQVIAISTTTAIGNPTGHLPKRCVKSQVINVVRTNPK